MKPVMKPSRALALAVVLSAACCLLAGGARADEAIWLRRSGFKQLRQGAASDGGQNVYVSRKGRLQTINRLDLNLDGEIDLLFTQDHNSVYTPDALIYWGTAEGYHSLLPDMWQMRAGFSLLTWMDEGKGKVTRLPAMGGGRAEIADLNADGLLDIVFCNAMHNYRPDQEAFIYWGSTSGFDAAKRTALPAYRASGVAVGDLNGDGLPDIVLANSGDERGESWGFRLHRESYVYWGSPDGYDASRRASIPTISAADVAMGDFNGDGSPDLAFVNDNSQHQSAYIYWNDGDGRFDASRRQVLDRAALRLSAAGSDGSRRPAGMFALRAVSLDEDRFCDLVIAGSREAIVYRGAAGGLSLKRAVVLPADNCHGVQAADLNGDGLPEIVLANEGSAAGPSNSTIYWADRQGYDDKRRTDLPTLGAKTVQVADLNDDGYADILLGNAHDDRGRDVSSYIYWGGPRGYAAYRRSQLTGFGVLGSGVADLNRDGRPDILLVSGLSGRAGTLPTVVFWGNQEHHYSSASATALDVSAQMEYSVADLDDDGYPDLVCLPGEPLVGDGATAVVLWGSAKGHSIKRRTALPVDRPMTSSIADLNRDGHLDIVLAVPSRDRAGGHARSVIVWGNADRFERPRTDAWDLSAPSIEANNIADLNRDGYLDLIFPMAGADRSEIWYGSCEGYKRQRSVRIPANGAPHAVPADLDRDGWLDLIFTSGGDRKRFTVNTPTLIYWGGPDGLSAGGTTKLEGYTVLDATVADLNRDGHLDIAMTNYRSDTNRKVPTFIYWGDGGRGYTTKRRTVLKAGSGAAIDALDLDRDGWPDLVVSNHQENFDHSAAGTDIFWGGASGFSRARRTNLPTIGVHLDSMVDAGNAQDRRCRWHYEFEPVEAPTDAAFARLHWKGRTDLSTAIAMQVRSAAKRGGLEDALWHGPSGVDSFYTESAATLATVPREHRWLQYRAVLSSPSGANSAYLTEVAVQCRR